MNAYSGIARIRMRTRHGGFGAEVRIVQMGHFEDGWKCFKVVGVAAGVWQRAAEAHCQVE